jgi:hypothetical protein
MEAVKPTPTKLKVADVVVTSALDLQTAFGVGECIKRTCIQFEPKLQAHSTFLDDALDKPLSQESLTKAMEGLTLFPDDFLTDVVEFIDTLDYSIQVRSMVAYDYMSMVAANIAQHVKRKAGDAMIRIKQSGIQTADNSIIH